MEPHSLVIVDQQPAPSAIFPALLKTLHQEYNLDAYSCRQRLLGQAQALLCKGAGPQMQKISACLQSYGIEHYCFTPSLPKFSPFLLSRLEITSESLTLWGKDKHFSLSKNSRTLIVLAEMSGKLVERQMNQLLSAHRFQGSTQLSTLKDPRWLKVILQGRPVLDIYLLDAQGLPQAAVRALPGKFDHRGLGEHATLSASQNLVKLAELVKTFSPASRLDMRFGLSLLPGASLSSGATEDLINLKNNLRNLTRYAWLQADIDRVVAAAQESKPQNNEATDAVTTLLTSLNPQLAGQQPLIDEFEQQLKAQVEDSPKAAATSAEAQEPLPHLPAPPALQRHSLWTSPQALIGVCFFTAVTLTSFLGVKIQSFGQLLSSAAQTGLLSGFGAFLSVWLGFKTLKLKRLVENTPTSKIRSLAMGLVEIKGTDRRQFALFSPMSHLACVYYRLTRYKKNQKDQWVVSSITSSGHVPFWVEDETGRVSVDPTGAKIQVGQSQESFSTSSSALGGFHSKDEKWREELIYDGALIYVLGKARVKTEPVPRLKRRAEALRALKQDALKMRRFDRDGDGKIDATEWQAARDSVEEQLQTEDLNASTRRKQQQEQIIIGRDELKAMPFVIAEAAAEVHLTRRYAIYAGFFLGTALVLTGLTLWLIISGS